VIGDMLGDLMASVQPVEIKIFGDNQQQLKEIATQVSGPGSYLNITPVKVEILQILAGDQKASDTILINQHGGTYVGMTENNKIETIPEIYGRTPVLEQGSSYLMFLADSAAWFPQYKYRYWIYSDIYGWAKIEQGQLITDGWNNLFKGLTLDDAIAKIKEALPKSS